MFCLPCRVFDRLLIAWNRLEPEWTSFVTVAKLRGSYERWRNMEGDDADLDPNSPAHAVVIYVDKREGASVPFLKRKLISEADKQKQKKLKDPLNEKGYCMVLEELKTPLIALAEGNNYFFLDKNKDRPENERFLADIAQRIKKAFYEKYGIDFNLHILEAPYKEENDETGVCAIFAIHMVEKLFIKPGYWLLKFIKSSRNRKRQDLAKFSEKNIPIYKERDLSSDSESSSSSSETD